jgi:hypothetical protein
MAKVKRQKIKPQKPIRRKLDSVNLDLDWGTLSSQMLTAAKGVASKGWNTIQPYAESEFAQYGQDVILIKHLVDTGSITQADAALHMQMQQNSMKAVFCTIEGVSLLVAEAIINAAIDIIRSAVNTALGFVVL